MVAFIFLGATLFGIWGLRQSFGPTKQIVLGPVGSSAPKSTASKIVIDIPYPEILNISERSVFTQLFLDIQGKNGRVTINQLEFESKVKYKEFYCALNDRVEVHQN